MTGFDPSKIRGSAFFGGAAPAAQPPAEQVVEAAATPQAKPEPPKAQAPATKAAPVAQATKPAAEPRALAVVPAATGLPMVLELDGGATLDIAAWVENDPGMGDLDQLSAPLPVVSAGYSQSKIVEEMGLKEGLWTHQATGEQVDTLSLVVIDVKLRRDLRAKYESGKDEQLPVICEAPDGKHGKGSDEFDEKVMKARPFVTLGDDSPRDKPFHIEAGTPCKDCPFAEWRDTKDGRKPPLCKETYQVVGDDAALGPVVVPFRGKGIKPLSRWRTQWWLKVGRLQGAFRQATGRHLPAPLFGTTEIRLVKEKTYYVPIFGPTEPTPQDRFLAILSNHRVYGGVVEMLGSHDAVKALDAAAGFDVAGMED